MIAARSSASGARCVSAARCSSVACEATLAPGVVHAVAARPDDDDVLGAADVVAELRQHVRRRDEELHSGALTCSSDLAQA